MQVDASWRVGQGFDVHAFAENRPLVIGGVQVSHDRGLAGHSDADVLTHAICDALLGGARLGDIGQHFPDTDAAFKDADSLDLLSAVTHLLTKAGWGIVNVDVTIIAQEPRMAPHLPLMAKRLGEAMNVDPERINLKATTTETLGFTGRKEGIAAQAVALLGRLRH